MIVTYDHNQDILTHHNQKRGLWAICIPIYTSPSRVGEVKKYLLLKPNTIKFLYQNNLPVHFTSIGIQIIDVKNL